MKKIKHISLQNNPLPLHDTGHPDCLSQKFDKASAVHTKHIPYTTL